MTAAAEIVVDGRRRWVLDLPNSPYVTPNSRHHWSVRSRKNRVWRSATALLARQARIPALDRIEVRLDYWPPDRRRRDADNLVSGVLKPCVDGLVDAGVVADDSPEFVRLAMPVIHEPRATRQVLWLLYVDEVLT